MQLSVIIASMLFTVPFASFVSEAAEPDEGGSGIKEADEEGSFRTSAMIVAGGSHTVALKNDGTVWTWGSNNSGQLGGVSVTGPETHKSTPVQVMTDLKSLLIFIPEHV
ncbi:MAG: hypothetical protein LBV13_05570 [Methanomassiliicoccaceae archaeon]|jgi:hypothetical protein|nr:hypothetical protein [Methanomassiliicoccaceae archaeon]